MLAVCQLGNMAGCVCVFLSMELSKIFASDLQKHMLDGTIEKRWHIHTKPQMRTLRYNNNVKDENRSRKSWLGHASHLWDEVGQAPIPARSELR